MDVHDLNYFTQDDTEVGVKWIAFNNKQSIHIVSNINQPNVIIIQPMPKQQLYVQFMESTLNEKGEKSGKIVKE